MIESSLIAATLALIYGGVGLIGTVIVFIFWRNRSSDETKSTIGKKK